MQNKKKWIGLTALYSVMGICVLMLFQNCSGSNEGSASLSSNLNGTASPVAFVAGDPGALSAPGDLRAITVANSWVELHWQAPGEGQDQVAEYKIYRDGIPVDSVRRPDGNSNGARTRYFKTNSFIDCNYVESTTCNTSQPQAGATHSFFVTAVDSENRESSSSSEISIDFPSLDPRGVQDDVKNNSGFSLVFQEDFSDISPQGLSDNWEFRRVWDEGGAYASNPAERDLYTNTPRTQQIINGEKGYMVDLSDQGQIDQHNPFRSSQDGNALEIWAQSTPSDLQTPAFSKTWDANGPVINPLASLPYATGLLRSKVSFTHGFIEARIKVAGTHGMLSTFYLFNETFSVGEGPFGQSEIDIMEYLGGSEPLYGSPNRGRKIYQSYHYHSNLAGEKLIHRMPSMSFVQPNEEHFSNAFHNYAVFWEPGLVIWYIDDQEVHRVEGPSVTTDPKYLVLSLVVGGEWAGNPNAGATGSYQVDYVRVYQRNGGPNTNPNPGGITFDSITANVQYRADNDSSVLMKLDSDLVCNHKSPTGVIPDVTRHGLLNQRGQTQPLGIEPCP